MVTASIPPSCPDIARPEGRLRPSSRAMDGRKRPNARASTSFLRTIDIKPDVDGRNKWREDGASHLLSGHDGDLITPHPSSGCAARRPPAPHPYRGCA